MTDLTIDMIEGLSSSPKRQSRDAGSPNGDAAPPGERSAGKSAAGSGQNPLDDLLARLFRGRAAQEEVACKPKGEAHGPVPSSCAGGATGESALARCLEASSLIAFTDNGDGSFWGTVPFSLETPCRIECAPLPDDTARVTIDTGYRVRRGRIRAANQLAMAINGILRVRGFSRIGPDGAVRFAFTAPCDDPELFEQFICLGLSSCKEALRPFSLIANGASTREAYEAFADSDQSESE